MPGLDRGTTMFHTVCQAEGAVDGRPEVAQGHGLGGAPAPTRTGTGHANDTIRVSRRTWLRGATALAGSALGAPALTGFPAVRRTSASPSSTSR